MAKAPTSAERKMYAEFIDRFRFCWACGWSGGFRAWMVPRLENAHIVGGAGRRHDRRAIARLCAGCHRLSHGDRIVVDGIVLPTLSLQNLLWLKQAYDPEWYDVPYLQSLRIKRAEALVPEELPEWFRMKNQRPRPL